MTSHKTIISAHGSRSHALCSPSSAHRWLNCSGCIDLCKDLPRRENKYADEGIRAHELAEEVLKSWLKMPYAIPDYVEDEMINNVNSYTQFVKEKASEFDVFPYIRLESKLTLSESLNMYGTADVAMTGIKDGKTHGKIIDLKYGKTKVVAKENPQLAYYGAALIWTSKKRLEDVEVSIFQPKVLKPVTSVTYSHEDLRIWTGVLTTAADKAYHGVLFKERRQFNIGKWCKYCEGKDICPAYEPDKDAGLEFLEENI